jgi:hypothetical protein
MMDNHGGVGTPGAFMEEMKAKIYAKQEKLEAS